MMGPREKGRKGAEGGGGGGDVVVKALEITVT